MPKYNSATLKDYKQLLELVNEFEFDNFIAYQSIDNIDRDNVKTSNKKYVKQHLNNNTCNYILCREKEEILGYIFLTFDEIYKGDGYINELYILPKYRKNGFATKLVDLGIKWLKKNKCSNINITVSRKNKFALKLYKKFGFDICKDSYVSMKLKI